MATFLEFDRCLLDLDRGVLYRDGERVDLRRQAFEVLAYLVEHWERIVTRQELFDRIWGDREISEWSLSTCIKQIRQAIGDTQKGDRLVRTVYGLGYSLLVSVIRHEGVELQELLAAMPKGSEGGLTLQEHWMTGGDGGAPRPLGADRLPEDGGRVGGSANGVPEEILLVPSGRGVTGGGAPVGMIQKGEGPRLGGVSWSVSRAGVQDAREQGARSPGKTGRTAATFLIAALEGGPEGFTDREQPGSQPLRRHFHRTVQQVVSAHAGSIQETSADEVVCTFGIPLGLPHHAERAVEAAVDLTDRWSEHGGEQGAREALRIYVDSRWIVWERPVGLDRTELESVRSTARWLRARRRAVGSSEIVVSQGTTRRVPMTGGRKASRLGGGDGIPLFRLSLPKRRVARRWDRRRSGRCFVGRQTEMERLQEQVDRLLEGQGGRLSLTGEAGIGKSRLVAELCRWLGCCKVSYEVVELSPRSQWMPYGLLAQLVRDLCGIKAEEDLESIVQKVRSVLRRSPLKEDPELPVLLAMLCLAGSWDYPRSGDPSRLRRKLFDACRQLVVGRALRTPLVLVIENLQWLDPTSSDWLGLLSERIERLPILLLATRRTGEGPVDSRWSAGVGIQLGSLAYEESRCIVAEILASQPAPLELVDRILEKAGGNPLFLEELSMACVEAGESAIAGGLPSTVQAVLTGRIDGLTTGPRGVLEVASCLGSSVDLGLLREVTGLPDEALDRHLAVLLRQDFLQPQPGGAGSGVRFKHAVTRDAVYESCPVAERRQIHRKVAATLIERHPETERAQPELLAEHYGQGGMALRAAYYWHKAAGRALLRSAPAEAAAHVQKGLSLLEQVEDARERAEAEIALRTLSARVWMVLAGPASPQLERERVRVGELLSRLGRSSILPEEVILLISRGDFPELDRQARTLIDQARQEGNLPLELAAHNLRGIALTCLGRIDEGRSECNQVLELQSELADQAPVLLTYLDPVVMSQIDLGATLNLTGYLREAEQALVLAGDRARKLDNHFGLTWVALSTLQRAIYLRETESTRVALKELLDLGGTDQVPLWEASAGMAEAWLLARDGDRAAAIAKLESVIERFCRSADIQHLSQHFAAEVVFLDATAAQIYLAAGDKERGLTMIDQSLELPCTTGHLIKQCGMWWIKGELLLLGDRTDEQVAEQCFERSIQMARAMNARTMELMAAVGLARLRFRQGEHRAAAELLQPMVDWFTEAGQSNPDLLEARELLASLPSGRG
ncbi:MAG: AAA family ATPase [Bradymonadales bacterium]|nr:AAA family ATPase [Bradymonadales bacterium]